MGSGKKATSPLKVHPVEINRPQKSQPWQPSPQCVDPPPFTLADVRNYIKSQSNGVDLFEPSLAHAIGYLIRDLVFVAVLGALASYIEVLPSFVQPVGWLAYWNLQGCVFVGMWILAHECGHRAFSKYQWVNNLVGHLLHSALLVPYHSWRITHSHHHANTNSVEDDAVYNPYSYDSAKAAKEAKSNDAAGKGHQHAMHEAFETTPINACIETIKVLTFGWPSYLFLNIWGPDKHKNVPNSHFDANSALFASRERGDVRESVMWWLAAAGAIVASAIVWGPIPVLAYYIVPYMLCNAYLISITLLQHTDTYVPHWHRGEFTFLRGALATVDRSWGWLRDELFHHISDSHVVHHLFSEMPFYNAVKATEILEGWKDFQKYRLKDYSNMELATVRSIQKCRCAPTGGDVCWYEDGKTTTLNYEVASKLAEASDAGAAHEGEGKKDE